MTDATTTTHTDPKKKSPRPGSIRQLAGYYVDLLFSAFLAWVACFTFNGQAYWLSITLFLWFAEVLWCRDRLIPTAGEFILGIRYMTSSSSHVVADIQVLHPKLVLNAFLVFGGVVDLTLSLMFLSGWTFLGRAVVVGIELPAPWPLVYWVGSGFLFFLAATSLLGGSKNAVWMVPLIHAWFVVDFYQSFRAWTDLVHHELIFTPWISAAMISLAKNQSSLILGLFSLYSLFLLVTVTFSRRHLVN